MTAQPTNSTVVYVAARSQGLGHGERWQVDWRHLQAEAVDQDSHLGHGRLLGQLSGRIYQQVLMFALK